jgi:MYXO-CTERM domain-containing protein
VVSTGAVTPLGNVPNVQGVVQSGATVYAVAANNPGAGAIYQLAGGTATPLVSSLGTGYLGGIAVDAGGNLIVTDSNDPTFTGAAGKLLRFTSAFVPLPSLSLAGGGGSGAYDVALDSDGDAFVTTGATITRGPDASGAAEQFGSGFTGFPFLTSIDFTGTGFEPGLPGTVGAGRLWVNATFSDDAGIIGVTVPEPGMVAAFAAVALLVSRSRKRRTSGWARATSLAAFASVSFVLPTAPARAEQFFATQVISRTVGAQQQSAFTDPNLALGAPRGGGTTNNSLDVYCLGNGGVITLGFDDGPTGRAICNGPGWDFIVAENAFLKDENPSQSFAEFMWVEVSTDGAAFARFAASSMTESPVPDFGTIDPGQVGPFAGVRPVFANADDNAIDPFNPATAGGDGFDLDGLESHPLVTGGAVDLDLIRYVRLVDVIGDGRHLDPAGRPIYDPTGPGIGGADVDAVAVRHGVNTPEPSAAAALFGAAAAAAVQRRRA